MKNRYLNISREFELGSGGASKSLPGKKVKDRKSARTITKRKGKAFISLKSSIRKHNNGNIKELTSSLKC